MNLISLIFYIYLWFDWSADDTYLKNYKLILACLSTPTIIYEVLLILMLRINCIPFLLNQSYNFIFPGFLKIIYNLDDSNLSKLIKKVHYPILYCDDGLFSMKGSERFTIILKYNKDIVGKHFYTNNYFLNENWEFNYINNSPCFCPISVEKYTENKIYEIKESFVFLGIKYGLLNCQSNIELAYESYKILSEIDINNYEEEKLENVYYIFFIIESKNEKLSKYIKAEIHSIYNIQKFPKEYKKSFTMIKNHSISYENFDNSFVC